MGRNVIGRDEKIHLATYPCPRYMQAFNRSLSIKLRIDETRTAVLEWSSRLVLLAIKFPDTLSANLRLTIQININHDHNDDGGTLKDDKLFMVKVVVAVRVYESSNRRTQK